MRALTIRTLLMTLTAGGLLAACSDSPVQPGPAPVTSIAVLPGEAALTLGDSVALEVVGFDAENTPRPVGTPTFTSQNPAIARVTPAGKVTTHGGGYTRIQVVAAGITTLVGITVLDPNAVAAVELSHGDLQLTPNVRVRLAAAARTLQGEVVYGLPVTWSSTNPAAASVADDGEVTAVAVGTARITATIAGRQASLDVTVEPAPTPTITTWTLEGVDFGDLGQAIASELLDQRENYTVSRITQLVSGTLTWNTTDATWRLRLVTRTFTQTRFIDGSTIIGDQLFREWDETGTTRATAPVGTHEFLSATTPGKVSVAEPAGVGLQLFHLIDPAWRKVYLKFRGT